MNPLRGRLLSIAELAKEHGVSKRTMAGRLAKLDELYGNKLLIRPKAKNGKILVREDLLRLATLGLQKGQAPVPQYKYDELHEAVRALKKQVNGYGARLRKLETRATCERVCTCPNTFK